MNQQVEPADSPPTWERVAWRDGEQSARDRLRELHQSFPTKDGVVLHLAAAIEQLHRQIDRIYLFCAEYAADMEVVREGRFRVPEDGLVVHEGSCSKKRELSELGLSYAPVPLGIVLSGSLLITEDDKDVRRLRPGYLIGLYETCAWLAHRGAREGGRAIQSKRVGRWSVRAQTETKILFLPEQIFPLRRSLSQNKNSFSTDEPAHRHEEKMFDNLMKDLKDALLETARDTLNPQPVSELPLLDNVVRELDWPECPDMAIVCRLHLLPSAVSLLKHLANLVGPANLFVLEKAYSTVPWVRAECEAMLKQNLVREGVQVGTRYEESARRSVDRLWDRVRLATHEQPGLSAEGNAGLPNVTGRYYRRLVVLDDGGELISAVPDSGFEDTLVTAVEQTSSGIWRLDRARWYPRTVDVAYSAAKQVAESPVIARAVFDKLAGLGVLKPGPIGLLGLGRVGHSLARLFIEKGYQVLGFDPDPHRRIGHAPSALHVIQASDLIIGCSGQDPLAALDWQVVHGERTLVSASSRDDEFRSVLHHVCDARDDPFAPITVRPHAGLKLRVLNGGFPINFDREREWEPAHAIQLTRALLYTGVVQALLQNPCDDHRALANTRVMLDPHAQRRIVRAWLRLQPEYEAIKALPRYRANADWWREHSCGVYQPEIRLLHSSEYRLHWTTRQFIVQMRTHVRPYVIDARPHTGPDAEKGCDIRFELQQAADDRDAGSTDGWMPLKGTQEDPRSSDWKFVVFPGVWSPLYDRSSFFHVQHLPEVRGRSFLEVGCGCGVISVAAALAGARRVVAVDINDCALKNTRENFQKHGFSEGEFVLERSDIFDTLTQHFRPQLGFDVILYNSPYHGSVPQDLLESSAADADYDGLARFLAQARDWLAPEGVVVLGASTTGDEDLVLLVVERGWKIQKAVHSVWREGYDSKIYFLRPK